MSQYPKKKNEGHFIFEGDRYSFRWCAACATLFPAAAAIRVARLLTRPPLLCYANHSPRKVQNNHLAQTVGWLRSAFSVKA